MKRDRSSYFKEYYKTHAEYFRNYRKSRPGYSTAWKRAHPDKAREHVEAWRARHPDLRKIYDKVQHAKRRACRRSSGKTYTISEWRALCIKYKHKCLCCKKRLPLTADHVVPLILGGSNGIENIQPLCGSCNSRKHTQSTDYRNTN